MGIEREVLEFIIVPPFAKRAAVLAAKERMEANLANRFPGYSFRVAQFAPVGDEEELCILPIMNFLDEEGIGRMCTPPKSKWLVAEISVACREFDAAGRRSFAA